MKQLKIKKSQAGTVITTTEDYVVYKKVNGYTSYMKSEQIDGIAILCIPKGSKIVVPSSFKLNDSLHYKKLRCNHAFCLGIVPIKYVQLSSVEYQYLDDEFKYRSRHSRTFKYEQGKYLVPTRQFNDNFRKTCKAGIHFFENVEDAEKY